MSNTNNSYKLKNDNSFSLNKSEKSNYCCLIGPLGLMYIRPSNEELNNIIKDFFDEKHENRPAITELRNFDDSLRSSFIYKSNGVIRLSHTFIFSNTLNGDSLNDVKLEGQFIIQQLTQPNVKPEKENVVTSLSLFKREDLQFFSLKSPTSSKNYYIELPFNGNKIKIYIINNEFKKLYEKMIVKTKNFTKKNNSTKFNENNYSIDSSNKFLRTTNKGIHLIYDFELAQHVSNHQLSDTLKINGPFLIHTEQI